jgi:hypothetical protein
MTRQFERDRHSNRKVLTLQFKLCLLNTIGCLVIFFISFVFLYAQTPETLWTRTYGGGSADIGYSISQAGTNGFIIAGYTSSFGSGQQDMYVIRINNNGDTLWTRAFGGAGMDGAHCAVTTADNGYIIAGYTESFGAGGKDIYLVKVDANGNPQWTKTYGGTLQDVAYKILTLSDGYIIVGYKNGPSGWTKGDLWLLKTNLSGDTLWTKTYGGIGEDYGISIRQTYDNGFVISGTKSLYATSGKDVWLLKTNNLGETLWTRTYGGAMEDVGYGVNLTQDSGYIITGYINGTGPWTAGDLWLLKTNAVGETLWTKIYGSTGEDFGFDICSDNNGYIITGAHAGDIWFLRTGLNGDTTGTQRLGGAGTEQSLSLCETQDNNYIIAGWTSSFGAGNGDVYVIKIAMESGIEEENKINIRRQTIPTIISTQLTFPSKGIYQFFDITGKEMKTNDVGQGVYFLVSRRNIIAKVIKLR